MPLRTDKQKSFPPNLPNDRWPAKLAGKRTIHNKAPYTVDILARLWNILTALGKTEQGQARMIRKIIHINEEQCIGCALCVNACHEGAIGIVDGKARLLREDYCDGLGNCLPACPTAAITFAEREAAPYDEAAVQKNLERASAKKAPSTHGTRARPARQQNPTPPKMQDLPGPLAQWPVQIKLVPVNAPYFANSNLLIAADCSAFACGNFHSAFMRNRITLIGCPKLDGVDYSEKLTEILAGNAVNSVTVVRMDVPCCGGLEQAVKNALQRSGKMLPRQIVILSKDGRILGGL
ncbi:MAG: 4Fe-4S binding protein [Desulfovibrio sp.]|jgi:NAD-dependent dihydropyrimidine dehydrogenase PreA subunit|nr:4Fe-4S binding protein [Desulfovibrio sp.]